MRTEGFDFAVVGLEFAQEDEVAVLGNVDPELQFALLAGGHLERNGSYHILQQKSL